MTLPSSLENPFQIGSTATTLVLSPLLDDDHTLIPTMIYKFPDSFSNRDVWEDQILNSGYHVWDEGIEILRKAEILNGFASKLINNSEELDPSFARIVSEKFWDLI